MKYVGTCTYNTSVNIYKKGTICYMSRVNILTLLDIKRISVRRK